MPATPHPSGCYYANVATVTVQRQCNPLLATALAAAGFVGNDGAPANATNAFSSFNEALAAAQELNKVTTGGAGATGNTPLGSTATNPLTGLNAVGDLAQRLTQSSTWIRVGEVLGGALLLYIGGNAVLRGTAAGNAAKSVVGSGKKVAKVAAK
jgi:hypothetical protein